MPYKRQEENSGPLVRLGVASLQRYTLYSPGFVSVSNTDYMCIGLGVCDSQKRLAACTSWSKAAKRPTNPKNLQRNHGYDGKVVLPPKS